MKEGKRANAAEINQDLIVPLVVYAVKTLLQDDGSRTFIDIFSIELVTIFNEIGRLEGYQEPRNRGKALKRKITKLAPSGLFYRALQANGIIDNWLEMAVDKGAQGRDDAPDARADP
ncbi:uncharacterized protein LOC117647821 [Thrips palmi]|uniref:Uncharacterized protein LOC117647821 n=1 Tax=Thrips palmi TaxID=161013 RepID=A0A6P8Z6R7_THRPL|nr:uncharacterized protein LOC117647821 [Thrips palmi]